jgi:hypothetical protein
MSCKREQRKWCFILQTCNYVAISLSVTFSDNARHNSYRDKSCCSLFRVVYIAYPKMNYSNSLVQSSYSSKVFTCSLECSFKWTNMCIKCVHFFLQLSLLDPLAWVCLSKFRYLPFRKWEQGTTAACITCLYSVFFLHLVGTYLY